MEYFWNIIHYFIYRAQYKFHLFFNRINPAILLYKLGYMKKKMEQLKVNPIEKLNDVFRNPDYGFAITWAWAYVQVLIICFFLGIINFISGILNMEFNLKLIHFIILGIITIFVNHILLFRKNKYLEYFKKFDKMRMRERKKWRLISVITILTILTFGICSFIFMDKRLY
jgi:hypothetical protein